MGFQIKFAFKNLGRHAKRTLITAIAIAVGLSIYIGTTSLLQGLDKASQRNIVLYETGSLAVYSPEGAENRTRFSLKYPLENSQGIQTLLESEGYKVVPRSSFQAELVLSDPRYDDPSSLVVVATAVDPARDGTVFSRDNTVIDGRWFTPGEQGVVLGKWLADDLGIKAGYPVSLSARTREGSYQVVDLTVTGILDSPNPNVNRAGVYLPTDLVDSQFELGGQSSELVVGMDPAAEIDSAAKKLQADLDSHGFTARVLSWHDLVPGFEALGAAKQKSSSMITLLVLIIAAVGISNTLLMAFYERKNEIATLRALGMDDRSLFWTFILEACGIGVIGSILGLILGFIFVLLLTQVGLDFGFMVRKMDIGYRITSSIYGSWEPGSFAAAFVLGVFLSGLSAILPTRRALKMKITDGLRTE